MSNQFDFLKGSKKHIEQAINKYHNNMKWLRSRKDQRNLLLELQNIVNPPALIFDENNYANIKVGDEDFYDKKEQGSEKYYKKLSNDQLGYVYSNKMDITTKESTPLSDLDLLKYTLLYELGGADWKKFSFFDFFEHDPEYHYEKNPSSKGKEINMLKENFDVNKLSKNAFISTIVGIGLGYHMKEFMQRTNPNLVFIADVSYLYVYLSLFCVNYKEIFNKIPDGNLHICINTKKDEVFITYSNFIHAKSRLAFHHASICAYKRNVFASNFIGEISKHKITLYSLYGFFTDQVAMHINTTINLKHGRKLINKKQKDENVTPVFIIGSGASIGYDLDFLKENNDKALIVACGSSLDILLKHQIKPDFYVWLEREKSWHDKFMNKNIDLSDIVLLSPATVAGTKGLGRLSPADNPLQTLTKNIFTSKFAHEISVIRYTTSKVWDKTQEHGFPLDGTTVTNIALNFIEHFNFQNIYLFGVDFGKKGLLDHHTKEVKDEYSEKALELISAHMDKTSKDIPANFGGMTTTMHPYSRGLTDMSLFLNEIYNHKETTNLKVYNCSDGAYIDRTITTFSESIKLDRIKDKTAIIDALYKVQDTINPSDVVRIWKAHYSIDEMKLLFHNIKNFYKNADWFSSHIAEEYHKIFNNKEFLSQNLLDGTLYDTFLCAWYFMQKVKPEYRKKAHKIVVKNVLDIISIFEEIALKLITFINVYLCKNDESLLKEKKELLLYFKDYMPSIDALCKAHEPIAVLKESSYLSMLDPKRLLIEFVNKIKLTVLADNYDKYINGGTVINILSNGLRYPFVSLESKQKLYDILYNWVKNTKNEALISTIDMIKDKCSKVTNTFAPDLFQPNAIIKIFASENIPHDYKEYLLKQMNFIDEYNDIEKIAQIDLENDDLETIITELNYPRGHHYLLPKGWVFFDMIVKPMNLKDTQFLLFTAEALPVIVDYYLENPTVSMEYDLLDEYYKLIENQLDDESLTLYERSNTMGMDWSLCIILEEKVLNKTLDESILSTDIYKQAFELNNEVIKIVRHAEYYHYQAGWNITFSFDINMDNAIATIKKAIKVNRQLLKLWKKHQFMGV